MTERERPLPHEQATSTRRVVALVLGREERGRLAGGLRQIATLVAVETVAAMRQTILAAPQSIAAVIVEARDGQGLSCIPAVMQLRVRFPRLPIIGYCDLAMRGGNDAVGLVQAGACDLIFRGIDDTGIALRNALASAQQGSAALRVADALRAVVAPDAHPFVEYCVLQIKGSPTVAAAARALGVHRKTLVNICARAALPAPVRLIAWCRLLLAAALLEQPTYSIEAVGELLEFPSSTAFRHTIRRHLGVTASEVRRAGGLSFVLARFREQMEPRVVAHSAG